MPERAVFVTEIEALPVGLEGFDRLYYGHETCPWRLPDRRELKRAREEAARLGMSFTLVTPTLDEWSLDMVGELLEDLDGDEGAEIVVNDVGLLDELSRRGRRGTVVVGRLLTRQRRGAGWRGSLPAEDEAAGYLMGSSLESPRLVEWFRSRYGIRRFEIDDLPGPSTAAAGGEAKAAAPPAAAAGLSWRRRRGAPLSTWAAVPSS